MQDSQRRLFRLALLLVVISGLVSPALTKPEVREGEAEPQAPDASQAPDAPPPVSSPWRSWHYNATPEQVRSAFEALFKEDGLSIKLEDKKSGSFTTDLVEFNDKKFGVEVSLPPPKAGPKYPWFQTNDMRSGRFGIEGKIYPAAGADTRVDIRALLEIRGMDQKVKSMRWIPRYSNGAVEQQYFTRLSLRLLAAAGEAAQR